MHCAHRCRCNFALFDFLVPNFRRLKDETYPKITNFFETELKIQKPVAVLREMSLFQKDETKWKTPQKEETPSAVSSLSQPDSDLNRAGIFSFLESYFWHFVPENSLTCMFSCDREGKRKKEDTAAGFRHPDSDSPVPSICSADRSVSFCG